jgi:hypothetical protein
MSAKKANREECQGGQGSPSGPGNGLEKRVDLQPIFWANAAAASTGSFEEP